MYKIPIHLELNLNYLTNFNFIKNSFYFNSLDFEFEFDFVVFVTELTFSLQVICVLFITFVDYFRLYSFLIF